MNKNNIKVAAITLATLQMLTLSGCKNANNKETSNVEIISEETFSLKDKFTFIFKDKINLDNKPYRPYEYDSMIIPYETPLYKRYNGEGVEIRKVEPNSKVKILETNDEYSLVEFDNNETGYVIVDCLSHYYDLNTSNYKEVNKYMNLKPCTFYNELGMNYGQTGSQKVIVLKSNNDFSLIQTENGYTFYVKNQDLYEIPNLKNSNYETVLENKDMFANKNTNIYDNNGFIIYTLFASEKCNAVANNQEYTLITLDNGIEGFIKNEDLSKVLKKLNTYAYTNYDTNIYSDKELLHPIYSIDASQLVYVNEIDETYAKINNSDLFIKLSDITILNGKFIDIDLGDQSISCYLDNEKTNTWGTRTGRDGKETHTGAFDIDWKAYDWEFTTYRGSYASYWIPINEYGEGIHDLIGDDEQNYGNEAYHEYGSHGCIRVPKEASKYVYENYDVGDMVLVHK